MAEAALTSPVAITRAGVTGTGDTPSADGNYWTNTGGEFLYVTNGSGGALTVTLVTQATVDGNAVADPTVTVADATSKFIGPFPRYVFNDANGRAHITTSTQASVTVRLMSFTPAGA